MFFPSLVMQAEELKMATQLSGPVMPIRNVSEALNQVLCVREFRLGFRGEDSCHSLGCWLQTLPHLDAQTKAQQVQLCPHLFFNQLREVLRCELRRGELWAPSPELAQ